jgi:histidyl-tRNA synthetase
MSFIKTPVKGMPEHLPGDMAVREFAMGRIKETFGKYGFSLIETPAIEHIENLSNREGGENEMLIFKIMKRGEDLEKAADSGEMCDCGLRYDLTVPLARFFANNMNALSLPFKALQIGSAWRADKPQKGRFRQFTQCDIDIIGDGSNLAEIELVSATAGMLNELALGDFTVRINDRRILKAMAAASGFPEEKYGDVFIVLDKLDKIGAEGVRGMLSDAGFSAGSIDTYCGFFSGGNAPSCSEYLGRRLDGVLDEKVVKNLDEIINCAGKITGGGKPVFDPSLVRGMSYYTGPIFEIGLADKNKLPLSVAGGGRYDEMIGKFIGSRTPVPACGFSIGLERIITLLKDRNILAAKESAVYLIPPDTDRGSLETVFIKAKKLRLEGKRVMISPKNKNIKLQIDKLIELGYTEFIELTPAGERILNIKA